MRSEYRLLFVVILVAAILLVYAPAPASAVGPVTRRFTTPYYDASISQHTAWTGTVSGSASKNTGELHGKATTIGWLDEAWIYPKLNIRDIAPFDSYVVIKVAYGLTYYQKAQGWGANSKVQVQVRIGLSPWGLNAYSGDLHYDFIGSLWYFVYANAASSYSQNQVKTINFQSAQQLFDDPINAGQSWYTVILLNLENNHGGYIADNQVGEYWARLVVGYIEVTYYPWV